MSPPMPNPARKANKQLDEGSATDLEPNAQRVERSIQVVVEDDRHEQQEAADREASDVERVGDIDSHRIEDKAAVVTVGGRTGRFATTPR